MGFIPTIIERNANIEHAYDIYSCLLKERIILCTGELNDELAASDHCPIDLSRFTKQRRDNDVHQLTWRAYQQRTSHFRYHESNSL